MDNANNIVRYILKQKKLSQSGFADSIGATRTTVWRWLNGHPISRAYKRVLSEKYIDRMSEAERIKFSVGVQRRGCSKGRKTLSR